jgi:hypothetical protein
MQISYSIERTSDLTVVRLDRRAEKAQARKGEFAIPVECMLMFNPEAWSPGLDANSVEELASRLIAIGCDQALARDNAKDPYPTLAQVRLGERNERTLDLLMGIRPGVVIDGVAATKEKFFRIAERLMKCGRITAESHFSRAA